MCILGKIVAIVEEPKPEPASQYIKRKPIEIGIDLREKVPVPVHHKQSK